ncbi:MAG: D-tyrosyl-tRNA(Tyr) deacylase [Gemmatimonadetes bacterium]|nr:D-tyrosyl-tRNA(Tyr) deacylase [Gemmatimonadota bacterium]
MRVLLQRVTEASVEVVDDVGDVHESGLIGLGLVALVGFAPTETPAALDWMAAKIANLRVFPDDGGEMDRSLRDIDAGLLVVSQFTLYADTRKGRRPDFTGAASYTDAQALYQRFCERCEAELPGRVATGQFGARMRVRLVNDGPVTLWLER